MNFCVQALKSILNQVEALPIALITPFASQIVALLVSLAVLVAKVNQVSEGSKLMGIQWEEGNWADTRTGEGYMHVQRSAMV